ncbi:FMRFamide receptor-like [Brachionus plicatilis]|uniref:FMRFamide receptor-like n=1 Tax=Brachionus plicatilis TaxID=10195 RepID=A0A3M7S557_BRAPC|nr:FMRFamide receptor-like [Brachionus plicatilis]
MLYELKESNINELCRSFSNDSDIRIMCNVYNQSRVLSIKKDSDPLIFSLIRTFYPFLLFFGLFGNSITFFTMVRIYKYRKNYQKFCFSLATLALSDLFVLTIGCLREYIELVVDYNFRSSSLAACKLTMFFCYLFSFFSVYLHAFIAIERWLAVSDPLKAKSKLTFRINRSIILVIFLLCIIINSPLLYFTKLEKLIVYPEENGTAVKSELECSIGNQAVLLSIDSFFYCLIPFVVTIMFSSMTVIQLVHSRQKMKESNQTEKLRQNSVKSGASFRKASSVDRVIMRHSTVQFDVRKKSLNSFINSSADLQASPFKKSLIKRQISKSHHASNLKVTAMLMALPICYLITTFPIFVIIIYSWFLSRFKLMKDGQVDQLDKAYAIAKIFMYVHNSINIFVYIFFGKSFRQDFIGIFPFKSLYNKITKLSQNSSNSEMSCSNSLKMNWSHMNEHSVLRVRNRNMFNDCDC